MNKAGSCQQSQQIQLNRNLSLNLNLNLNHNLNHNLNQNQNLYLNQNLSHNLCLSQNQTKIQKQIPPGPPRGGVGGKKMILQRSYSFAHTNGTGLQKRSPGQAAKIKPVRTVKIKPLLAKETKPARTGKSCSCR